MERLGAGKDPVGDLGDVGVNECEDKGKTVWSGCVNLTLFASDEASMKTQVCRRQAYLPKLRLYLSRLERL
jgi:uncharacterized ParB-like nuclease family protein